MQKLALILSLTTALSAAPVLAAPAPSDGEAAFRSLYKELVETNTTLSQGSCTLAAERMAARLKAAGYAADHITLFATPEHPKDGGLVARLDGSDPSAKPILLLAHLDTVEAKREDWVRDPFTLIEEGGYFYARGASDDKAMASVLVDTMARYKSEGFKPKRTLKLALTCGEETSTAFNGAEWLSEHHKDWIDAEFALNEGGHGELDADGKRVSFDISAAEKTYQDYWLESTNPGGHSSQPVPDNALYHMANALVKLSQNDFPVSFNDTTRAYFTKMADLSPPESSQAMKALLANPNNSEANAVLNKNKRWHSMLRTTCVATMIEGGHAVNALPQRVKANINCRIMPGVNVDTVRADLARIIDDPKVAVSFHGQHGKPVPDTILNKPLIATITKVASEIYPNVPVVPTMTTGASDGVFTRAAGIPTYGVQGMFVDPDFGNIHGLNERIRVQSLLDGRRFHYVLIKRLSQQ